MISIISVCLQRGRLCRPGGAGWAYRGSLAGSSVVCDKKYYDASTLSPDAVAVCDVCSQVVCEFPGVACDFLRRDYVQLLSHFFTSYRWEFVFGTCPPWESQSAWFQLVILDVRPILVFLSEANCSLVWACVFLVARCRLYLMIESHSFAWLFGFKSC